MLVWVREGSTSRCPLFAPLLTQWWSMARCSLPSAPRRHLELSYNKTLSSSSRCALGIRKNKSFCAYNKQQFLCRRPGAGEPGGVAATAWGWARNLGLRLLLVPTRRSKQPRPGAGNLGLGLLRVSTRRTKKPR